MDYRGEIELAGFRCEYLNGPALLSHVGQPEACVVISLPIGIGKSDAADGLIREGLRSGTYDLVVYFAPVHSIILERSLVRAPDPTIRSVVLHKRPSDNCGSERDGRWRQYERSDCTQLGRYEICRRCSYHDRCFWVRQYGAALEGIQAVFATQEHLRRTPYFVDQLVAWTKAKRPLVIIDETVGLFGSYTRRIHPKELEMFYEVLQHVSVNSEYIWKVKVLLGASTEDLRSSDWSFSVPSQQILLKIQTNGWRTFSEPFRDLTYQLKDLSLSAHRSRERNQDGSISFTAPPLVHQDMYLLTCSNHQQLLEQRLRRSFISPFKTFTFGHHGSIFFNLHSHLGAQRNFIKNSPQIFDFFTGIITQRLREGKRVVLVSKKRFKDFCATEIQKRLVRRGYINVRVVTDINDASILDDPLVIPVLHYGVIGINTLQDFDCIFCLNSYYLRENTLNDVVQDDRASDFRVPLEIRPAGPGQTRSAGARWARDRIYDLERIAPEVLKALEQECVLQVIGRVRPYTKPREVFMFQADTFDLGQPVTEFHSLADAREYFGLKTQRKQYRDDICERIRSLYIQGFTQVQTAEAIGLSVRQVQRYWKQEEKGTQHDMKPIRDLI